MKQLLPIVLILFTQQLLSQVKDDTFVNLDKNLTLKIDAFVSERHKNGVHIFEFEKDSIYFQILINDSLDLKVTNERLLNLSLRGVHDGLVNFEFYNDYSKSSIDTIIGNVPGIFISLHNNKDAQLKEIFYFVTIQDNHSYIIATYIRGTISDKIRNEINYFFSNLKFSGSPYPGYSPK